MSLLESSLIMNGSMFITQEDCEVYGISLSNVGIPQDELDCAIITQEEIDELFNVLVASRTDIKNTNQLIYKSRTQHDILSDEITDTDNESKPTCGVWLNVELDNISKWIWELSTVGAEKRNKHWPPPSVKNQEDLIDYSRKNRDIGWLNVGASPDKLRSYALAVLALHIKNEIEKHTQEMFLKHRAKHFMKVLNDIKSNGVFRLGVEHDRVMGIYNGKEYKSVVYDFDPTAQTYHCFPVHKFPIGVITYLEGQLEL